MLHISLDYYNDCASQVHNLTSYMEVSRGNRGNSGGGGDEKKTTSTSATTAAGEDAFPTSHPSSSSSINYFLSPTESAMMASENSNFIKNKASRAALNEVKIIFDVFEF